MNKLKTLKNLILGGVTIAFVMIMTMLPVSVANAKVTTPDWSSFTWQEIKYGDKINFDEKCGAYLSFTVTEGSTAYYVNPEPGHYYFKILSDNTIKFERSVNFFSTMELTNTLTSDVFSTPYITYLELEGHEIFLVDGACKGTNVAVKCGDYIYNIYTDTDSPTIYKTSDTMCIVDIPYNTKINVEERIMGSNGIYSNTANSATDVKNTDTDYEGHGKEKRYYIGGKITNDAELTSQQSSLKSSWETIYWSKSADIAKAGYDANNEIDELTNITDELKKDGKSINNNMVYQAQLLATSAKSDSQLERADAIYGKIDAIKDIITKASDTNTEIDNNTKLTDEEKTSMKEQVEDNARNAINLIKASQATDEAITSVKNMGTTSIQNVLLDKEKSFAKAELDEKAKTEKDSISKIENLTDYEKRKYKENIDTLVTEAKANIDKAVDQDAIDNAKKDAIDSIESEKKKAEDKAKDYVLKQEQEKLDAEKKKEEEKAKEAALKLEQDSNAFVKEFLTDENGKLITSVTETTLIKLLLSEERWNKLDQATKDFINQIIKNSGGVPYETLLAEAKKASQTVADVGDNYDKGTMLLYTSKVSAKATTLKWNKVTGADGYFVYTNFCNSNEKKNKPKLLKDITSANITTCKINKRTKNKWYKYRVVAYKNINGNKTPISQSLLLHVCNAGKTYKFANPTNVTVKKKSMELAVNKTSTIKAKVVMPAKKKYKKHTSKLRYIVSDSNIATVDDKGKITAKAAGTCTIYVCAQNGIYKTVKVTVK